MSNHFHLIIEGLPESIPRFVGWLKKQISYRVGKRLSRWSGAFWGRRYDAAPILDDEELEQKLAYIVSHGVKEGLVAEGKDWPGLHCAQQVGCDNPLRFPSYQQGKAHEERACEYLTLSHLPHVAKRPGEEYRDLVSTYVASLRSCSRPVTRQSFNEWSARQPEYQPPPLERSKAPDCHTTCAKLARTFREKYKRFRQLFTCASTAYRKGRLDADFPPNAFKPPVPPKSTEGNERS